MDKKTALAVFGLTEMVSEEELKRRYKQLCRQTHPDVGGSAYLFSLVSEARDCLMGFAAPHFSPSAAQSRPEQTRKTNRAMSWAEMVRQPDFIVPFDAFLQLASGETIKVPYRQYSVTLAPENLLSESIRTKMPVTITVKSWKSWFHWLFRCKPMTSTEEIIELSNGGAHISGPSGFFESRKFFNRVHIPVSAGWHQVRVSVLGRDRVFHAKTKYPLDIVKVEDEIKIDGAITLWVNTKVTFFQRV